MTCDLKLVLGLAILALVFFGVQRQVMKRQSWRIKEARKLLEAAREMSQQLGAPHSAQRMRARKGIKDRLNAAICYLGGEWK